MALTVRLFLSFWRLQRFRCSSSVSTFDGYVSKLFNGTPN